ncbi:ferritin-like domain-containing protein [Roseomonas marmotae]|uniref:Ferritin-like domain-containing protein n=1 Tax=Roseomonas marmotae TaxID=2768161 RepID=A0ABS3K784_9PROT|nr:ferritin-like domain-containing protein [Roseomonas marmotae]MBO1073321.1 ferritin-like domain-containing protein [Roseomonas marmotae]QTI79062.1 ferritin-like domain-containing protein [Roseomonas marmotae]
MQESYRDTYITGLVNARALEVQAIELMSRQLDRLQSYPEVESVLRKHVAETEQQRDRLDQLLQAQGTSHSSFKDFVTGVMGNMAAMGHVPMQDEIIKNSLANYAFEHFEIASYKSLLTLADLAGDTQAPSVLKLSLSEEERMAQWCEDNLDAITRKYASLRAQGEKAGI